MTRKISTGTFCGKTDGHHFVGQNLWSIIIARVLCVTSSYLFTQPGTIWLRSDIKCAQRCERYPTKEALQEADHEWDCSMAKDWFCEAIAKLPMMTIYRPGKRICWTSNCLLFSLKIRKLLQMRWVLFIPECLSYICGLRFIEGQAIRLVAGGNRCCMISNVWDQRLCGFCCQELMTAGMC
jgi:hypothetical protein